MGTLQRVTLEYVDLEDRIRLTGELASGDTVVLWLTQRLVNRLVPHLIAWLERQVAPASSRPSIQAAHQELVQGFAQQAARARLGAEPPVRAADSDPGWRVDSIEITPREEGGVLTFKGAAEARVTLPLAAQPLRQWLGIVYEQCLRGEWPTSVWPAWMTPAEAAPEPHRSLLH